MTRRLPSSAVSRESAAKYLRKAQGFRRDAEALIGQGGAFAWNGIAVLCIHAAIAYTDALTIRAEGRKSKSGDHRDAASFLGSIIVLRSSEDKAAQKALQALLNRKDAVSYADDLVKELDAAAMMDRLKTFAAWAEQRFEAIG